MTMNEFLQELDNIDIIEQLSEEGQKFYKQLQEKNQTTFTENGKKILQCMQKNVDNYKTFNAKQLGELLFMSPRSVSGSIKKLINEGYCTKTGSNPVCYELTVLGKEIQLD